MAGIDLRTPPTATAAPKLTPTATKTGDYTLGAGDFARFDCTNNRTGTLPAAPADGTRVGARVDVLGVGKSLTLSSAGSDTFQGGGTTLALSMLGESVQLTYRAAETLWVITEHGYAKAALSSAFVALPSSPTDGQVMAYNAASGLWVAQNPTGNSLLAYAENNTGTQQTSLTSANGTVDVTSCSIAPLASTRPLLLWASFAVLATVAPTNAAPSVQITEVSNGVDTPVTIIANGGMVTVINRTETLIVPMTQLASSTARTRTFKLQFPVPGTGTWSILNGSGSYRSLIGSMAG